MAVINVVVVGAVWIGAGVPDTGIAAIIYKLVRPYRLYAISLFRLVRNVGKTATARLDTYVL